LESPEVPTVVDALNRLATAHPEAQLLVLSEYTFGGPVPPEVRALIRKYHRYLIAGGIRYLDDTHFYDSAFVIGPDGNDVSNQAKSVPVQFMQDGLPADHRAVWNSPWGKIGIAVCYDLSYARVMDDFVRQGAQGLIVPTMDLTSWGSYERQMLHGRMAPTRSAEYGIPPRDIPVRER
jgi:predicted amidohydrolase